MKDYLSLESIPNAKEVKQHESPKANKAPLAFTIIFWILLGALVLYTLFMLLVPPLPVMNFRMLIVPNYTIVMYQGTQSGRITQKNTVRTIRVQGNLVHLTERYGSGADDQYEIYYEIDGDTTYRYTKNKSGEWETKELDSAQVQIGGGSDSVSLETLLNPINYKRCSLLNVHELKEGVWPEEDQKVTFSRVQGDAYEILISSTEHEAGLIYQNELGYYVQVLNVYVRFTDFGKTTVDTPWKES